jgi:hypothetical protein
MLLSLLAQVEEYRGHLWNLIFLGVFFIFLVLVGIWWLRR